MATCVENGGHRRRKAQESGTGYAGMGRGAEGVGDGVVKRDGARVALHQHGGMPGGRWGPRACQGASTRRGGREHCFRSFEHWLMRRLVADATCFATQRFTSDRNWEYFSWGVRGTSPALQGHAFFSQRAGGNAQLPVAPQLQRWCWGPLWEWSRAPRGPCKIQKNGRKRVSWKAVHRSGGEKTQHGGTGEKEKGSAGQQRREENKEGRGPCSPRA